MFSSMEICWGTSVGCQDGSLVAECAQLEADLDVRQREATARRNWNVNLNGRISVIF